MSDTELMLHCLAAAAFCVLIPEIHRVVQRRKRLVQQVLEQQQQRGQRKR